MIAQGMAPNRSELLRGEIVEKMPKSILHTKLTGRLLVLLMKLLIQGFWVRKEEPITTSESEPEPDLSIVEGSEHDYQSHPETAKLVIEVAVTTLAEDREMAAIYAEAGVSEYWIVNATAQEIEVRSDPHEGIYREVSTYPKGTSLVCKALPEVVVDVTQLFDGL